MAWIESHQELGRHPKLLRMSQQLRINKAQAVGHLHFLWWWTLDFSPLKGDLSAFTPAEISAASEWPGEPEKFMATLKDVGWIDKDGCVHDWGKYSGKWAEKRDADRKRKSRERKAVSS